MSILIGRHIKAKAGSALPGGLAPIALTQGKRSTPFGVYSITGLASDGTKDGVMTDHVDVSVVIAGKTYEEATEGAEAVRRLLEGVSGTYDTFSVDDCEVSGGKDGYDDQAELYTFEIKFTFTTLNY